MGRCWFNLLFEFVFFFFWFGKINENDKWTQSNKKKRMKWLLNAKISLSFVYFVNLPLCNVNGVQRLIAKSIRHVEICMYISMCSNFCEKRHNATTTTWRHITFPKFQHSILFVDRENSNGKKNVYIYVYS